MSARADTDARMGAAIARAPARSAGTARVRCTRAPRKCSGGCMGWPPTWNQYDSGRKIRTTEPRDTISMA